MIEKLINHINDKSKPYVIFVVDTKDYQKSKIFYKIFPNAKIFVFEFETNSLICCERKTNPYQNRITLLNDFKFDYDGNIDICYINDNDFVYIKDKFSLNKIKLLFNNKKILFDNSVSNLEMFCVYHKNYYFREDNFYFTFFGVNEVFSKEKTCNNILEYELEKYNPFLQKRGYMETSVYLHVYWNKLYKNKDMVGFSQYDMKHNQIYNNLDKKTVYLLNTNKLIVENDKWDMLMFPKHRNLDFLIKSYNTFFNKKYTKKELEMKPLSLWQTNIYPVKIYEKLCGWLEKLVDEIYPWTNQPPYETHFGSIGGYTERALSIFNAFEIYEGTPYSNLNIQHGIGEELKEQYNHQSFLNNYSKDFHCKIVEETDHTKDYCIVGIEKQDNMIIKENINDITKLFFIDEQGNKTKPLMIIGNCNNNKFNWKYNILDYNLEDYDILYKKVYDYRYDIIISRKKKQSITYKETIQHFVSKDQLKIPKNEFSNELKQRWTYHEYKTNKKILKLIDDMDIKKKQYILDAGSHIGDTLLMISLYLKHKQLKNVKVIGIEPDEEKISFIQDIIQLNHIDNIELKCNAISDEKGNYFINKSNKNSGAWTIENSDNGGCFVMLDEVCKDKSMYLIHLDVEGYEIKALNSGIETIKKTPHIILEYEHIGLNKIKNFLSPESKYEVIDNGDIYIKNVKNFNDEYLVNEINFSNFTMVNNKHIKEIQSFVDYINERNIEGAIVECGVWKGGIMMACIKTQQKYNEKREFYLYDTYEGMTEPSSSKDLTQDKEKYKIVKEWHKADINLVKNNVQLCNYNNENIHYVKGDVLETLNNNIPEKISILRLDTDWYESTKKELEVLYERVSNNGFVIIDDYNNKDNHGNPRGARIACNEFFPLISEEINIIKPLSNEENIPFCFQKKIRNKKITCFSFSNNNSVYDITFPSIKAYCEQNDYQFITYHSNLENKYKPHWNKLHYSIKLLKEINSEYIVWFDHDIVIKNYNIKLEDIINKYKFNHCKALFMMSQDPASNYPFNTGVIVFKNKQETLNIFNEFLEMRNNPHKHKLLNKYGGFNFNGGMQDTRVMLAYFHKNEDILLSIPHKVLQSFYGQAEYYTTGDLCGHVAGPQGDRLISKLNELKNYENFDIVIPVGPNDKSVIEEQIKHTKKYIIGYRNIFLICYDPLITIDGCITINENIFPFNIETVSKHHGKLKRNGWYLQQLLKLYSGKIVPNILERYLVIDSDTFFLKPITFIENNKCLYNFGTEYHQPYFEHMKKLDKSLIKINSNKSGICHHMMFEKKYINELISKIEKNHNELFYNIFLKTVTDKNGSGASEYEIYFNYMLKYYPDKIIIRKLNWKNTNKLETNTNYDYISHHWYMRR
jgi:FkbM family methyltransferase